MAGKREGQCGREGGWQERWDGSGRYKEAVVPFPNGRGIEPLRPRTAAAKGVPTTE